jgi:hypothetical protein
LKTGDDSIRGILANEEGAFNMFAASAEGSGFVPFSALLMEHFLLEKGSEINPMPSGSFG